MTKEKNKKSILDHGSVYIELLLMLAFALDWIVSEIILFNTINNRNNLFTMPPLGFDVYFNLKSFAIVSCHLLIVSLTSLIPVGEIVEINRQSPNGKYFFRANGKNLQRFFFFYFLNNNQFISAAHVGLFISLIVYLYCLSSNVITIDFLLEKSISMGLSTLLIAIALAYALYSETDLSDASNVNSYANAEYTICHFFQGKQINVKLFNVDVKTILVRFASQGTVRAQFFQNLS